MDYLLLLTLLYPMVICLQETFLKNEDNLNIKGYQQYSHIDNTGARASRGVSILIRNSVPQSNTEFKKKLI